jgi:hypothetical protein
MSVTGQLLIKTELNSDGYIDVSHFGGGMFLLKLKRGESVYYEKIVIE